MNIEKIDKLADKIKGIKEENSFIGIYLNKKFSKELDKDENDNLSHREKRTNLIKIYDYISKLPSVFQGLKSTILLEILENGLMIDEYNEDYFISYLKLPIRRTYLVSEIVHNAGSWGNYISNIQTPHNRGGGHDLHNCDRLLLTKYLEHFFLNGKPVSKFES